MHVSFRTAQYVLSGLRFPAPRAILGACLPRPRAGLFLSRGLPGRYQPVSINLEHCVADEDDDILSALTLTRPALQHRCIGCALPGVRMIRIDENRDLRSLTIDHHMRTRRIPRLAQLLVRTPETEKVTAKLRPVLIDPASRTRAMPTPGIGRLLQRIDIRQAAAERAGAAGALGERGGVEIGKCGHAARSITVPGRKETRKTSTLPDRRRRTIADAGLCERTIAIVMRPPSRYPMRGQPLRFAR